MFSTSLKSVLHHARYFPLWSALTVFRWRAFDLRSRALGTTFGTVMRWFPPARSRFDREAKRVFPNMKRAARAKLGQNMGRHMGRTLFEIYYDAEFQTQHHKFRVSGPRPCRPQEGKRGWQRGDNCFRPFWAMGSSSRRDQNARDGKRRRLSPP